MTVVLFEPHHDDSVLFACWTLLREKPLVVTVCGNPTKQLPQVTLKMRREESVAAWKVLGINEWAWQDWFVNDVRPDWDLVENLMREIIEKTERPTLVYAPLPKLGGHEHHNRVGEIAADVFGDRVRHYATYRRGERRTRTETEVPFDPHWPALKLRAMACYESQITLENTRPWFDDWQREWYG